MENDMVEMRRERRWPASLKLQITSLYDQGMKDVEAIDAPIEITDVSKAGIGFLCASDLPVGYYFNARLELSGERLKCVVHILRKQKCGERYQYGCEITGAAGIMDYVVNDYAATLDDK